jgi:hypothetical protein
MVYFGKVRNGVIIPPPEAHLAEGDTVRIEPVASDAPKSEPEEDPADNLSRFAVSTGITDMSAQHDHYCSGAPKRED